MLVKTYRQNLRLRLLAVRHARRHLAVYGVLSSVRHRVSGVRAVATVNIVLQRRTMDGSEVVLSDKHA